ncbi:N-acetyltransferase [Marivirga lumbricoides]|uniref:N-acetyltransferase n=1 Tax=Marivirga lumbricoides TaxID=1046115 RepID=A0A2T4DNR2_9BACT|nr:N-acetyltransferase [Marivirga lumbricoides]
MPITSFNLQPHHLKHETLSLKPLKKEDFEALFEVASDPEIWTQHPNKTRYQRDQFENYFKGAIESGGAFLILNSKSQIIGCSRYYNYDPDSNSIFIGYTFLGKNYWGQGYNRAFKTLMLDYILEYVDKVNFHVGTTNYRSQQAMKKLGAVKTGEIEVPYYSEPISKNFIYEISKESWKKTNAN